MAEPASDALTRCGVSGKEFTRICVGWPDGPHRPTLQRPAAALGVGSGGDGRDATRPPRHPV